jgi:hypothetical protein
MRLVRNHVRVVTIFGAVFSSAAATLAALAAIGVIAPPAGAATSPKLPEWVQVEHYRYKSSGEACVLVGTAGHKHVGAVCRDGSAHRLPDSTPHNALISPSALPPWLHSWGGGRVIVIGGGNADSTLRLRVTGGVAES